MARDDQVAAASERLTAGEAHVLLRALSGYARWASSRPARERIGGHQPATTVLSDLASAAERLRGRIAYGARRGSRTLTTSTPSGAAPHPLQLMHRELTVTEDQALWGALLDFEAAAGARADDGDPTAAEQAELASDLIAHLSLTPAEPDQRLTPGGRALLASPGPRQVDPGASHLTSSAASTRGTS